MRQTLICKRQINQKRKTFEESLHKTVYNKYKNVFYLEANHACMDCFTFLHDVVCIKHILRLNQTAYQNDLWS